MRVTLAIIIYWVVTVLPFAAWADAEWGRNPFVFGEKTETAQVKGESPKSKKGELAVEMAMVQGETRFAVVNGRKVKIGDYIDGAVISAITADSVTFVKNGKTLTRAVGEMDDEAR